MRGIVVAKMLILVLWAVYLTVVLSQPSGKEPKHAQARSDPNRNHRGGSPSSPSTEYGVGSWPFRPCMPRWKAWPAFMRRSWREDGDWSASGLIRN